jgi:hypothetical protein
LQSLLRASDARVADRDAITDCKEDRIERLEKRVSDFKQAPFGTKSESVDPDQYQLALEDTETAIAAVRVRDEATIRGVTVSGSASAQGTKTGTVCDFGQEQVDMTGASVDWRRDSGVVRTMQGVPAHF